MTNEQREALLAGKPTKEADITKHKDWQAWQGALTEQNYYGATENEMLRVLAHLIFAAGREAERDAPTPRIAELEAAQKWQPIESAPKNTFILGFFPDASPKFSVMICSKLVSDDSGDFLDWYSLDDSEQLYVEPTHWMPLPAPPETGDK